MFPILIVVSVIPCMLSAPAGADPSASASRVTPRIARNRARFVMCTSPNALAKSWRRSASSVWCRKVARLSRLTERAGQARPDVGPGRLHVGRRGQALGDYGLDALVDLVLAPV